MGIVQREGRPKPAYLAFATMARLLNDKRFVRTRQDWPGVYACEFASANGQSERVLAVWTTDAEREVEFPLPPGKARWMNTVGEKHPIANAGGTCKLGLQRNSPLYLLIP